VTASASRRSLEKIFPTCGRLDLKDVTLGWIRNTLELRTLALSENLLDQIEANPMLEVLGEAEEMEFDGAGNLVGVPVGERVVTV
jgi:hypothetical protein